MAYTDGLNNPADYLSLDRLNRGQFVVTAIGDSRVAAIYLDSGNRAKGNRSPLNWANSLLDERFVYTDTFGVSGDRTDNMLTRIDAAVATRASIIYIQGGVNNIGAVSASGPFTYVHAVTGETVTIETVAAVTARDIRFMAEKARAAGMRVIIEQEVGANGFSNAEKVGALAELRQLISQYAEATPNVFLHDAFSVVMIPNFSATALKFKTGYNYDATHVNARGAYRWGKSLSVLLARMVPQTRPFLIQNIMEVIGSKRMQVLNNPLFNTTTGTAGANGISGTIPQSYTVSRTGSATATVSTSARADGSGNDFIVAITFTAAGELVSIANSLDGTAAGAYNANILAGDVLEPIAAVEITETTNVAAVWLQATANTGSGGLSLESFDLNGPADANNQGIDEPAVLTLRGAPLVVSPSVGAYPFVVESVRVSAAGAGSCTIRVRQLGMRRKL